MHQFILPLSYVDDMVLFSHDAKGMWVLKVFCQSSELTIVMDKTKLIVVTTLQRRRYPNFMYVDTH